MPRGLPQAPWSLAQTLHSASQAPSLEQNAPGVVPSTHTQAQAEINLLEVGEEERKGQTGGQEERVGVGEEEEEGLGEGEGLGVGKDEKLGGGVMEEEEVVEEPISRYGRGGRVLKKPAKYS